MLKALTIKFVSLARANMKAKVLDEMDQFFLRKRAIVETIYDQLKNISQIEHSRHRSLVGGLIAY